MTAVVFRAFIQAQLSVPHPFAVFCEGWEITKARFINGSVKGHEFSRAEKDSKIVGF
jgi:hypothetical protein